MLTLDESSHVVNAEYGVGVKNKVNRVTWLSFGISLVVEQADYCEQTWDYIEMI